jgi:hypothetical protein
MHYVALTIPADSSKLTQPQGIINDLISREIRLLRVEVDDLEDFLPLMSSSSETLQEANYLILSRSIAKRQEEITLESGLSDSYVAKLPEELLSLILSKHDADNYLDLNERSHKDTNLLEYLFSWELIFIHWTNASYKVQSDYAAELKEGAYVKDLLTFVFDFLIRSRPVGRPVRPEFEFDIIEYDISMGDDPESQAQRLTVHLYYLCCLHIPQITKSWWRDDCPRDLQRPVEEWTEKYVSESEAQTFMKC